MRWTEAEDKVLRELSGLRTSVEMAEVLDRTPKAINHRRRKLGLNGVKLGEGHWNAKRSNLLVQMILTLYDTGYTPSEIQQWLSEFDLDRQQIYYYCYGARK